MGFAGNLRTLSLPEVVQTLSRIQATGVLRLARNDGGCDVVFQTGNIIGVGTRAGSERQALLNRLIMDGQLDAQAAAQLSASGSETSVVQALIDQGMATDDLIHEARQRQAEEYLHDLCTWEAADFVFIDAIPEEPDAVRLVERHQSLGMTFNTGSLLMEAARRMDEWSRVRDKLPHHNLILGSAAGQEQALSEAGADYPASAVVPLINAVRTIDEVIKDAMVPRLEVYQVIDDLLQRGIICPLSHDDVVSHADFQHQQGEFTTAARLYRRALNYDIKDKTSFAKLGSCLEHLGEGQEAAACFGQMAIGLLDDGDHQRATEFATHAVTLMPKDTVLRLTLARCHLMHGDESAAIEELHQVVKVYLENGQLEDARGTCLKILDIRRQDEFARRELARIFSRVEHDRQSEDVVVCVQCGTVNHREATQCTSCQAPLQLSCLACGRIVAVSDPLCIFCGADPHAGGGERRSGGSPTTSRIIRRGEGPKSPAPAIVDAAKKSSRDSGVNAKEKGSAYWRDQLDQNLRIARDHEAAGHLEEALTAWREVAKVQLGNADLISHIKNLEIQVNQRAIEQNIEAGHAQRRTRRYWGATKAYRAALRAMASDDPRLVHVQEALRRTEHDQRRITMIYGAATTVLIILGFAAARPYVQSHQFRKDAESANAQILELAEAPPEASGDRLRLADQAVESLAADAERIRGALGNDARSRAGELRSSVYSARMALGERLLEKIEKALSEGRAADADQLLTTFTNDFGGGVLADRQAKARQILATLKGKLKIRDDEAKAAPAKLEAARGFETENRLADALAAYREVAATSHVEAAAAATAAVARLTPLAEAALEAWRRTVAIGMSDLKAVREGLAADEMVRACQAWNREGDRLRLLREADTRLEAATQAFNALGAEPTIPAIQSFLAAHGAAPEAARAKTMLAQAQARSEACERALATYRGQMEGRRWADAWQSGRDLVSSFGRLVPVGQVVLPLLIETSPPGATVTWKGKEVGKTPLVLTYLPADDGEVTIRLASWRPRVLRLADLSSDWRTQVPLVRQESWRLELGKGIDALAPVDGRFLTVLVGDGVARLDAKGGIQWRHVLLGDDLAGGRARLAHTPALLPEGGSILGLPGHDAALLDAQGNPTSRITTVGEVRGRPLVYVNDAYGAQTRLALAADGIFTGPVGGEMVRIPLPCPALAGPISVERGLDRVLVVGLVDGRIVGVEESTRTQPWQPLNVQASDIGQFVPIGPGQVAVVLDGGRLAMIRLSGEGIALAWSQVLKGSAVGDPAVSGTIIGVSTGPQVQRFGANGSALAAVPLPAPASSAPALDGDAGAVGCQDGSLVMWKGDRIQWTTACGGAITAVALLPGVVVAGLADGTVLAFPR